MTEENNKWPSARPIVIGLSNPAVDKLKGDCWSLFYPDCRCANLCAHHGACQQLSGLVACRERDASEASE